MNIIFYLSIILLLGVALTVPCVSAPNPIWTDEFTSYHSRWDWNYSAGTGYKERTTIDGLSAMEIGVTAQSSASSYSDCSLHEKNYHLNTGVFEARLRYAGDHNFGTMGWGMWNYANPEDAESVWFWDSSTGGVEEGFQVMSMV